MRFFRQNHDLFTDYNKTLLVAFDNVYCSVKYAPLDYKLYSQNQNNLLKYIQQYKPQHNKIIIRLYRAKICILCMCTHILI